MSGDIWWYAFCGNRSQKDAFWDYQLTVNTSNPDLTRCFQTTVLTWVPCALLLIWSPFHILYLSRRATLHHKWSNKSRLNVIKLVLGVLLCVTALLQLIWVFREEGVGSDPPPSELVAACIILIAMVLSTLFIHYEFKKGVVSSGILFVFWLLLTLCNIVTFRSYVMDAQQGEIEDMFVFITFYIYFALLACQFLLSFKADCGALLQSYGTDGEKKPLLQNEADEDEWVPTPEAKASYLSTITYFWIAGTIVKGYKKVLEFPDLCDLMYYDKSKNLVPKFEKAIGEKVFDKSRASSMHIATLQKKRYVDVDSDTGEHHEKKPERKPEVSLFKAILATSGWQLLGAATCRGMAVVFTFVNPQLLRLLIAFVEGSEPYVWKGYLISLLLLLSNVLSCIFTHGFLFLATTAGMRLRTMITCAIYRKALRLSSASRRTTTVGEIVNLMSVDAVKIQESCTFMNLIWTVPVLITLSIYFLWGTVGPSSLAGFAVLLLIVPSNAVYLANKIRRLQEVQMKYKDNRIKMMNEILSGIKVLKFYAWEPSFQDKVMGIRELELDAIKKAAYINAGGAISWFLAPYLVSLATFAVYVLSSPENILDADKAFVSLSLINVLNWPLALLPMGVSYAGQVAVSIKRINKFLRQEELEGDIVQRTYTGDAIRITDGVFSWSKENRPVLSGVELSVPDGGLIAVVGQVGSGKSSLIASILGEMHVMSGQINVKGSVAYVPQQAWIQNATLRGNILFGRPLNQRHYQKIIRACAMEPDLRILPGKDMTEIGEKGINLSGGQKQRVSLARAVYQDCDVYLLDDPLSAVDAHVGKHIFEEVVGPQGILKDKTRILVTHGVTYLPHVDRIVVIKDGRISEMGTYEELLSHDGAFAEFIRTYLNEEESISESDAEETEARVELHRRLSHLSAGERSTTERSESESGQTSLSEDPAGVPRRRRKHSTRKSISRRESQTQHKQEPVKDKLISDETAEVGAIKYDVLMMYIRAGGVGLCVLSLLFHLFFIAAQVGTNIWLSEWSSDGPINGSWPRDRTDLRLGIYGAFGVAQGVFVLVEAIAVAVGCVMASRVLHAIILDRVLKAPMSYFDTTPLGRILNRFSKDMDVIDFNMPLYIRAWLFAIAPLLSTLVVISYTTPYFLIVVLPIGVVYYLLQKLYIVAARQFKRIDSIRRSPLFIHFDESVVGATSIRAYRQQQRFIAHSDQLIDNSQRAWYPVIVSWRWLGVLLESLGAVVVFFASLFAVIQRDAINGALAGLSVSYALQVTRYMNTLVRSATELETYIVSVERIKEYTEVATEADWVIEESRPPKDWPVQGQVEFVDYSTRYRAGLDLVLRGISCSVEPQQKVGIVGRTGAGKSSLTLSLFRIIEATDGQILIDGQNIGKLGLHDLRSRLTIIPQDPVLFSGTLRMNLDPFEKYNDAAIWRALEHAHLKTFVSGLNDGLGYECGEGGEALSVGQRQLVCLARALLRKTQILILDEATAAVDMETDDLIQATIRTQFSKCTVLTIAHRLNTIMDYDMVLVLDNGQTREYGAPAELLKDKKGVFYGMAKDANLV